MVYCRLASVTGSTLPPGAPSAATRGETSDPEVAVSQHQCQLVGDLFIPLNSTSIAPWRGADAHSCPT